MAKPRLMDEKELETIWKGLPQSDKRFISTMIFVSEVIGDETLHYGELPTRLERTLQKADRNTLFSIIVECLGLLLDPPAMGRIKKARLGSGKPLRVDAKKRQAAGAVRTRGKAKRSRSK